MSLPQTPIRPEVLHNMPIFLRPLDGVTYPLKYIGVQGVASLSALCRDDLQRNGLIIRRGLQQHLDDCQLQLAAPE